MENITIRPAGIADLETLQKIGRQTFFETFSATNTKENMAKYLDEGFATEKLITELNNDGSSFYFAELNGGAIGYLKLNTRQAQTEPQDSEALEIERIYVLQAYRGRKVGQMLYEKAIQVAQQENVPYIWLGVWEHNLPAIRFYQKNGFTEFDKHVFRLGDAEQTDIMMRKNITP